MFLCDSGECYFDIYYNFEWVKNNIGDLSKYLYKLEIFFVIGCLD